MGTLVMVVFNQFLDFRFVKILQKPLNLCLYPPTPNDPLDLYILLVNDSIDPIILIGLPHQLNILL